LIAEDLMLTSDILFCVTLKVPDSGISPELENKT
jgi:hypothetical protein